MCFSKWGIGCCGYNIRRYDPEGRTVWLKRFDGTPQILQTWQAGGGYAGDALHACARSDDSVAVVGRRNDRDYDLRVFAADGATIWERDVRADAYPAFDDESEYFYAVAVGCTTDRVGVLWVVNRIVGGPHYGNAIYDSDGELISAATMGTATSGTVFHHRGAVDANGIFYGCGRQGSTGLGFNFSISGDPVPTGLSFNYNEVLILAPEDMGADVDADEVDAEWWTGTAFPSRFDLNPTTYVWAREFRTVHLSRLQSGDLVGAGEGEGEFARPIRIYDWATGDRGATWPTNGPDDLNWQALRVRHMRPNGGCIACLTGSGPSPRHNIARINADGEIVWRHWHTADGFFDFAPSPDGSVTGVTQFGELERTNGDRDFVEFDEV